MSYDLMVFQPDAAPANHSDFLRWYLEVVEWDEGHSYDDPAITTPQLRAWFFETSEQFPPLNGPFSKEDLPDDESTATDYSIGKSAIYACFAWSKVEPAYQRMFDLAAKHKLGFFNVSSNQEEVWLPIEDKMILTHQKTPPTLFNKLAKLFKRD
jgi:hypothetical protein